MVSSTIGRINEPISFYMRDGSSGSHLALTALKLQLNPGVTPKSIGQSDVSGKQEVLQINTALL